MYIVKETHTNTVTCCHNDKNRAESCRDDRNYHAANDTWNNDNFTVEEA